MSDAVICSRCGWTGSDGGAVCPSCLTVGSLKPRGVPYRAERLAQLLADLITLQAPRPRTDEEDAIAFLALANLLGALLAILPPVRREAHLLGFIGAAISAFRQRARARGGWG